MFDRKCVTESTCPRPNCFLGSHVPPLTRFFRDHSCVSLCLPSPARVQAAENLLPQLLLRDRPRVARRASATLPISRPRREQSFKSPTPITPWSSTPRPPRRHFAAST